MIGSVVGTIISEGKNVLIMALCVSTGITLFGLVDQDYTLSEDMIKSLGLEVLSINMTEPTILDEKYNDVSFLEEKYIEPTYSDIVTLTRGVIGVRKIGY